MTIASITLPAKPIAADVLASVQQRLAALGDGRDCKSDNEREAYGRAFGALDRRRMAIRDTVPDLAAVEAEIAPVTQWIAHLTSWRAEWCTRMNDLPARAADRTREQEFEMVQLVGAIKAVDFGCTYVNGRAVLATLLAEKIKATYPPRWDMQTLDPWQVGFGCIEHAEARLADLVKKRDVLQSHLDAAMREPEST